MFKNFTQELFKTNKSFKENGAGSGGALNFDSNDKILDEKK